MLSFKLMKFVQTNSSFAVIIGVAGDAVPGKQLLKFSITVSLSGQRRRGIEDQQQQEAAKSMTCIHSSIFPVR